MRPIRPPRRKPAAPGTGQRLSGGVLIRYMLGMIVDATGSGMYLPVSLLFFHHVTGLPVARVGLIMSTAALLSLVSNPLAGVLVDRYGARAVVAGGYVVRAAGFCAYPLVTGQLQMFAAVALVAIGDGSFPPSIQSFAAEIVDGAGRDRLVATQRSLRNAGLGIGGLIAAAALGLGSDAAYRAIVLGSAAAFLIAAALIRTIPITRTVTRVRARGGFGVVFRNRPFMALSGLNVPIAFGYTVLSVSLPVYITQKLHAGDSLAGLLFAVNTVGIATLQMPVTWRIVRWRRTRSAAAGAMIFFVSFVSFAALTVLPPGSTLVTGVFAGTALFTAGELLHGAAASALAASAAPAATRGRHLAIYQLSWAIPTALAPAALTALLELSSTVMWLVLAVGVAGSSFGLIKLESRLPVHAVRPGPSAGPGTGRSEPAADPVEGTPIISSET